MNLNGGIDHFFIKCLNLHNDFVGLIYLGNEFHMCTPCDLKPFRPNYAVFQEWTQILFFLWVRFGERYNISFIKFAFRSLRLKKIVNYSTQSLSFHWNRFRTLKQLWIIAWIVIQNISQAPFFNFFYFILRFLGTKLP